ncbi:uncharacterized protein EI90DRAFT_65667 [Cantharellus anzutake]|uniref:uncharacterized protein n=1 Tax=Cantharellus anzutake TaxID=1750568 RepID=UPI001907AAC9|nr:uncharacterized protein EI90DRAFT_65667 [Cantharellus anzutake]KAF8344290.1 hypothetical protein EI90DRAFT_65667 [Cantharellus anzutake]
MRSLTGAAVFGHSELYTKLKGFRAKLKQSYASMPRLYFVKVDVQACFDSIDQDKLLSILDLILSNKLYRINKFQQVTHYYGKVKTTRVQTVVADDEEFHFVHAATKMASALRHTIFVDELQRLNTMRGMQRIY